ncbi:MAG: hypothetical protein IPH18_02310 [Chitinophagaceae bacterium]|nr:hypothetical protein [Chitinophagaceae bacterium]
MQLSHRVKLFTAVLIIVLCNTIYSCAQGDFGTPAGSPQAMTANDIAEIQTVWIKKKLKRNNEQLEKADK